MFGKKPLFSLFPIIPHIILVLIAIGGCAYIIQNNLFADNILYIYYGVKIFIALAIIFAAARSFLAPTLGILIAACVVFLPYYTNITFNFMQPAEGWQLLILSIVGLLVSAFCLL